MPSPLQQAQRHRRAIPPPTAPARRYPSVTPLPPKKNAAASILPYKAEWSENACTFENRPARQPSSNGGSQGARWLSNKLDEAVNVIPLFHWLHRFAVQALGRVRRAVPKRIFSSGNTHHIGSNAPVKRDHQRLNHDDQLAAGFEVPERQFPRRPE